MKGTVIRHVSEGRDEDVTSPVVSAYEATARRNVSRGREAKQSTEHR